MTLHDPLSDRQPNARSFILIGTMQSLEDSEDPVQVPRFDSDPVVPN